MSKTDNDRDGLQPGDRVFYDDAPGTVTDEHWTDHQHTYFVIRMDDGSRACAISGSRRIAREEART